MGRFVKHKTYRDVFCSFTSCIEFPSRGGGSGSVVMPFMAHLLLLKVCAHNPQHNHLLPPYPPAALALSLHG